MSTAELGARRRILITGGSGFVGSNLARVFAESGAAVLAPSRQELDMTDRRSVRRAVSAARPDVIVHAAIWNEHGGLLDDRHRAWDAFVTATRNVVDAANGRDAHLVLVSSDWVFDGTQGPASEDTPPNPVNAYGFLKAASELIVHERAERGTIARTGAVQGIHRARARMPRAQDAGFGYFVATLVEALQQGQPFVVWEGPELNELATPTLATHAAELILRAVETGTLGILHCVGGEHASRIDLALRAAWAFELDGTLIETGPAPDAVLAGGPYPRDTRLDARATAKRLGVTLPDLDTSLARLRAELTPIDPAT